MSWDDPRWAQMYPPRAGTPDPMAWPTSEPDYAHEGGAGTPGSVTPGEQVPHYLDLIAAEAAANPAPTYGVAPGLSIADAPGGLI